MAIETPLLVAGGFGRLHQLVRNGAPLRCLLWIRDSRVDAVQRVGERARITELRSHVYRFAADRGDGPWRRLVAKRPGEPGEQLDPQHAVVLGQRGERVLQQRYEAPVASGAQPDEPPAVPDRRPG